MTTPREEYLENRGLIESKIIELKTMSDDFGFVDLSEVIEDIRCRLICEGAEIDTLLRIIREQKKADA